MNHVKYGSHITKTNPIKPCTTNHGHDVLHAQYFSADLLQLRTTCGTRYYLVGDGYNQNVVLSKSYLTPFGFVLSWAWAGTEAGWLAVALVLYRAE